MCADRYQSPSLSVLATRAKVREETVDFVRKVGCIDLHLETSIPYRLYGYDVQRRHRPWPFGAFFGHADLPRVIDGGVHAAMWSFATNVAQPNGRRVSILRKNIQKFSAALETGGNSKIVFNAGELQQQLDAGVHGVLLSVQGGNAFEGGEFEDLSAMLGDETIAADLLGPRGVIQRATLVHLSNSRLGQTSSPIPKVGGQIISDRGRNFVRLLNKRRVFVDLAHTSREAFFAALEVHDASQPALSTHTGIQEANRSFRNLDAEQVQAIAKTGGVVGIIVHKGFLGRTKDVDSFIDHAEAAIAASGPEIIAFGSDYDGFIIPPKELRSIDTAVYRIVERMLERGWSRETVRGFLSENFLRTYRALRP